MRGVWNSYVWCLWTSSKKFFFIELCGNASCYRCVIKVFNWFYTIIYNIMYVDSLCILNTNRLNCKKILASIIDAQFSLLWNDARKVCGYKVVPKNGNNQLYEIIHNLGRYNLQILIELIVGMSPKFKCKIFILLSASEILIKIGLTVNSNGTNTEISRNK